jgi:hypothetical protein
MRTSYNNHLCIIDVANMINKQIHNYYVSHTPEVDALVARLVVLCAECEGPTSCSGPGASHAKKFSLNVVFLHPRLILCTPKQTN